MHTHMNWMAVRPSRIPAGKAVREADSVIDLGEAREDGDRVYMEA